MPVVFGTGEQIVAVKRRTCGVLVIDKAELDRGGATPVLHYPVEIGHCSPVSGGLGVDCSIHQAVKVPKAITGGPFRPGIAGGDLSRHQTVQAFDVEIQNLTAATVGAKGGGKQRQAGRGFGKFGLGWMNKQDIHMRMRHLWKRDGA